MKCGSFILIYPLGGWGDKVNISTFQPNRSLHFPNDAVFERNFIAQINFLIVWCADSGTKPQNLLKRNWNWTKSLNKACTKL